MYSYIGAYFSHLHRNHNKRIVYLSDKQLPDDRLAIEHNSILLPFLHELNCDTFRHPSNDDFSDTAAAANIPVSIQSILRFGHVFMVPHIWTSF